MRTLTRWQLVAWALTALSDCTPTSVSRPDSGAPGARDGGTHDTPGRDVDGRADVTAADRAPGLDRVAPSDLGASDPGPLRDAGGSDHAAARDAAEPVYDAGPCGELAFGQGLTLTPVNGASAAGRPFLAPTAQGGAVMAWRSSGVVRLTQIDGAGNVVGGTQVVGNDLYGLAVGQPDWAVLVSRGVDVLALVIVTPTAAVVHDDTVIGGVSHDVEGNEWFGSMIRQGRLIWTGSGWAAYYTVQRLWPDGVQHYGDQLRLYQPDGSAYSTLWDWGCSHSMELRVAHNGQNLGPLCASDCYPGKGIYFNHNSFVYADPGANCGGGYSTSLGASVAMADGFWLAFTATDGRDSHDVAVARVNGMSPGQITWLTGDGVNDRAVGAARFDSDLLVAWEGADGDQIALLDGATGAVLAGPLTIDADFGSASDLVQLANGDIGWAQRNASGGLSFARLRACR